MTFRFRPDLVVTAAFVVGSALGPAPLFAQQTCKTDGGPFQSTLVGPPDCASAVGICTNGTLDGKFPQTYQFVMDFLRPALDPAAPNKFIYGGHSVITRVDGGAQMFGQDTGVLYFDTISSPFITTVKVVSGTKEYADAKGQFVAAGQIDFTAGQATGAFASFVCK